MAVACFDSPFVVPSRFRRGSCLSACAVVAIYAGLLAHRYLRRGVFTVEFSFIVDRVVLVRYRGHAPRMDYLALFRKKRFANQP